MWSNRANGSVPFAKGLRALLIHAICWHIWLEKKKQPHFLLHIIVFFSNYLQFCHSLIAWINAALTPKKMKLKDAIPLIRRSLSFVGPLASTEEDPRVDDQDSGTHVED